MVAPTQPHPTTLLGSGGNENDEVSDDGSNAIMKSTTWYPARSHVQTGVGRTPGSDSRVRPLDRNSFKTPARGRRLTLKSNPEIRAGVPTAELVLP